MYIIPLSDRIMVVENWLFLYIEELAASSCMHCVSKN